jgi:hypothetical protein
LTHRRLTSEVDPLIVRKTTRLLVFSLALAGLTACGDTTVTSSPVDTSAPVQAPASADPAARPTAASLDETDFDAIDALLRDIEADLRSIDQDVATPEGDPTE